jgi:hypothetical protein
MWSRKAAVQNATVGRFTERRQTAKHQRKQLLHKSTQAVRLMNHEHWVRFKSGAIRQHLVALCLPGTAGRRLTSGACGITRTRGTLLSELRDWSD